MAQAGQAAMQQDQGIEYTIYTFDMPVSGQKSANKWEKQGTKTEMTDAVSHAEKLFKSGKFQKVEVKQKYFDKKKDRNIDMTLKVFEAKPKREINVFMIFAFAVLCGAAAFGITYFLAQ